MADRIPIALKSEFHDLELAANRLQQTVLHLGFRFWVPFVQIVLCVFAALSPGISFARFLSRTNVAVVSISQLVRASVPLIPIEFWEVLLLASLWHGVGHAIDRCKPARLKKRDKVGLARRSVLLMCTAGVAVIFIRIWLHAAGSQVLVAIAQMGGVAFSALTAKFGWYSLFRVEAEDHGFWQVQKAHHYTVRELKEWLASLLWHHFLLVALAAWILICMLVQEPSTFVKSIVFLAAVLYVLKWVFPALHQFRFIVFAGALLAFILSKAGSYNVARDVLILFICLLLSLVVFWRSGRLYSAKIQVLSAVLFFFSTWVLWSAGDALFPAARAPIQPERFLTVATQRHFAGKRVGLALSGGGYRASMLEAGMLSGLERLRIPVTNVSSVSGGSITAAYYAAGGRPEDLLDVFVQQRLKIYRDMLDLQNFARMAFSLQIPGTDVKLLPGRKFTRTEVQAEALDRVLFGKMALGALPNNGPKLMLCATDLNTGRAVGVSSNWMLTSFVLRPPGEEIFPNVAKLYKRKRRLSEGVRLVAMDSSGRHLSQLVAASGAFPFAFEPMRLDAKAGRALLADGGVTDNSGMTLLLGADWEASHGNMSDDWAMDLIIAGDGGAMFAAGDAAAGESVGRAIEIIGARIGLQLPDQPRGTNGKKEPSRLLLSPTMYVDNSHAGYDYSKIGMRLSEDGHVASLSSDGLDPQQQRLTILVTRQTADLDEDSLELLSSIDRRYEPWVSELKQIAAAENREDRSQRKREVISKIAKFLTADFSQCLQVFLTTPTLKDSYTPEEARSLFRLGQYLVVLNAHEMHLALSDSDGATDTMLSHDEKKAIMCATQQAVVRDPKVIYQDLYYYQSCAAAAN